MKVGDKVVFIGNERKALREHTFNRPKRHSIVVLKSICNNYSGAFVVRGYETDLIGAEQSFYADNFKPLDYDFVERILENIKEADTNVVIENES